MGREPISELATGILQGMEEALKDARGHSVPGLRRTTVRYVKPKEVREHLHMSQREFSEAFGIPLATLQNWEQGRRKIDGTAASYLRAILKFPNEMKAAQLV